MKLKSVASLKGPLACSIILILKTYFLSLTAMGMGPDAGMGFCDYEWRALS